MIIGKYLERKKTKPEPNSGIIALTTTSDTKSNVRSVKSSLNFKTSHL
jgi:hypothetical protein